MILHELDLKKIVSYVIIKQPKFQAFAKSSEDIFYLLTAKFLNLQLVDL